MNLTFTQRRTGHEGKGLELLILASQTDVLLTKIPRGSRTIPGGKSVSIPSSVDFFGIHKPSGRMICFDAKQSKNPNRLETSTCKLAEHQRLEILRYGEAGAIAGLLCERSAASELFWCDWRQLQTRRPSIPWDEMTLMGSSRQSVQWIIVVFNSARRTTP